MHRRCDIPTRHTEVDPIDAVFEALASDKRRALLVEIVKQRAATAAELAAGAGISRQGVSRHMAELSGAGLVARRRLGRQVFYKVTPAAMFAALGWIADVGSGEALAQQEERTRKGPYGLDA